LNSQGHLYVIAAPSGAGKTSLVRALVERLENIKISISYTTRPPRPADVDGRDYFFVSENVFQQMIAEGVFLEHAFVFGRHYGTSRHWVLHQLQQGTDVILEIDWQGAQQIRRLIPEARSIYILPPCLSVLQQRLLKRRQDSAEVIEGRMREAQNEIAHCQEFDYLLVNDVFDDALAELTEAVLKVRRGESLQKKELSNLLAQLLQRH